MDSKPSVRDKWRAADSLKHAEDLEQQNRRLQAENEILRELLREQLFSKKRPPGRPAKPKAEPVGVRLSVLLGLEPRKGRPPKYSKSERNKLLGSVEKIQAEQGIVGKKGSDKAAVKLLVQERYPEGSGSRMARIVSREEKMLQNQLAIARKDAGRLTRKPRRIEG